MRPFARSLRPFAHRSGVPIAGWTVAIWVAEAGIMLAIAYAAGWSLSPQDATLVVAFGRARGRHPGRAGRRGTYDGAVVLGLKAATIAGGAASGILSRVIVFGPPTIVGLVLRVTRYGGLRVSYRTSRNPPVLTS